MHALGFDKHPKLNHVLNLHLHEEAVTKSELARKVKEVQDMIDKAKDEVAGVRKAIGETKGEMARLAKKQKT